MPTSPFEETRIGDFSRPVAPSVAAPKSAIPTPPTIPALPVESQIEGEVAEAEQQLKPLEAYEAKLKAAGVTRDEAARMIDAILSTDGYTEDVALTPRHKVKFRTRDARDTRRIMDALENLNPRFDRHYQELLARMTLAATLAQFGATKFVSPPAGATAEDFEKAFQTKLSFVENLKDPVLRMLLAKLWKFDYKVSLVLEEGTIENF